jgi:hypothetical protein
MVLSMMAIARSTPARLSGAGAGGAVKYQSCQAKGYSSEIRSYAQTAPNTRPCRVVNQRLILFWQ